MGKRLGKHWSWEETGVMVHAGNRVEWEGVTPFGASDPTL